MDVFLRSRTTGGSPSLNQKRKEESTVRCPVCKEPMIVLELDQIEVDHCLSCGGAWLDSGELELLLEGADNRDRLLASFEIDSKTKEKKVRCPICSKKMAKIACGTAEKVCVDSCPKGEGLWFDKGELLQVVRMGDFPGDRRIVDLLKEVFSAKS